MKLGLGTVQLGLPYGIANTKGQPAKLEAFDILRTAINQGITLWDTSAGYGASEKILGEYIRWQNPAVDLVTKLPGITGPQNMEEFLADTLYQSLETLGRNNVYGYLLHAPGDLFRYGRKLVDAAFQYVKKGAVGRFGVSVYTPQDIEECLKYDEIQIIQLPLNILDGRIIQTGLHQQLQSRGIEVHARSAYLQGLLQMKSQQIPEKLLFAIPYLDALDQYANTIGLSRQELAFQYVRQQPWVRYMVMGCETKEQVAGNAGLLAQNPVILDMEKIAALQARVPEKLVNPVQWSD